MKAATRQHADLTLSAVLIISSSPIVSYSIEISGIDLKVDNLSPSGVFVHSLLTLYIA